MGSRRRGEAVRKEEYRARRVVGISWPEPRERASGARERAVSLNFVLRIAGEGC